MDADDYGIGGRKEGSKEGRKEEGMKGGMTTLSATVGPLADALLLSLPNLT